MRKIWILGLVLVSGLILSLAIPAATQDEEPNKSALLYAYVKVLRLDLSKLQTKEGVCVIKFPVISGKRRYSEPVHDVSVEHFFVIPFEKVYIGQFGCGDNEKFEDIPDTFFYYGEGVDGHYYRAKQKITPKVVGITVESETYEVEIARILGRPVFHLDVNESKDIYLVILVKRLSSSK